MGPLLGHLSILLLAAIGLAALAMMAGPALKDALVKLTKALPDGATTSTSDALDTGVSTRGVLLGDLELKLSAPALTTGELPDAVTVTYNVITSANSSLAGNTTLISGAIVQTGASSAGAAAATYNFKIPSTAGRYVGFNAVGSGNGTRSGKSATLEALF